MKKFAFIPIASPETPKIYIDAPDAVNASINVRYSDDYDSNVLYSIEELETSDSVEVLLFQAAYEYHGRKMVVQLPYTRGELYRIHDLLKSLLGDNSYTYVVSAEYLPKK